ncbi:MAG: hypothetical protein J1E38_06705 [Paramuribaculum sp.]|nr:hypothetical protein [Paramuribaculum sp.]
MNLNREYKCLGAFSEIYQSKTISTKELIEDGKFNHDFQLLFGSRMAYWF